MKRDWRPTLTLIAALLVSLVLVWLGREVGAHIERDAAWIARLTRDDPRLGSPLHFGRALAPIDARYVDASAIADAETTDAYEAPDLAAPVIRRYCEALVNRVCLAWSACECQGMPPRLRVDETEVGTCTELTMPHCENWSVWTEFRATLARSPVFIDEAALLRFETEIAQNVDCSGIRNAYPDLLVNDADVGHPCNAAAAYGCRDGSDCIDDVCTRRLQRGEPCALGDDEVLSDDPCNEPDWCDEGLVCADQRCTPRENFDCPDESFPTCALGDVLTWRVAHHSSTPECMPIGPSCMQDMACAPGRCVGERTRVCRQPTMQEHPGEPLRTVAVLDGYQGDEHNLPTASIGEECRHHICAEGLSCAITLVDHGGSGESVAFVCRESLPEGADCSIGDCESGLVCHEQVRNGHCTAPICETEYLFY